MDDETARALLACVYEPNERQLLTLLNDYQPNEIVKLHSFASRIRSCERNAQSMLNQALSAYTWITPSSPLWPLHISRLRESTPLGLWLSGNTQLVQGVSLAIVGSRLCSTYGAKVAMRFAEEISRMSIAVVAGGATGIESSAHRGALKGIGSTIAVLAGGFTHLYPESNGALLQTIEDDGLLISETAPWRRAKPHWFLARNRLIAALSEVLVVVETEQRSSAMSCVTHANAVGIDVCVVPGPIQSPLSEGSHALIRDGATLVTSVEDIMKVVLPTIKMQHLQAQFTYEPSL